MTKFRRFAGILLVAMLFVAAVPVHAAPGVTSETAFSSPWDHVVSLWQQFSALFNWEAPNDEPAPRSAELESTSPTGETATASDGEEEEHGGIEPWG